MATIKSYTDLEQSKVLAGILPHESADYCWGIDKETLHYNSSPYPCAWKDYTCKEYCIPCWSLAALLGVLPEIQGGKPVIALNDNYITYPHMSDLHTKADNLVDACYSMILKLKKLNWL